MLLTIKAFYGWELQPNMLLSPLSSASFVDFLCNLLPSSLVNFDGKHLFKLGSVCDIIVTMQNLWYGTACSMLLEFSSYTLRVSVFAISMRPVSVGSCAVFPLFSLLIFGVIDITTGTAN